MSIRLDFLNAKLTRFLDRYSPPRDMKPEAQADESAALLRALDRAAPKDGYDNWWLRFEDVLAETLRTRSWPSVGDVAKAAGAMPRQHGVKTNADDGWLESGLQKRVKRWLDGCPGDGEKGIPEHIVTRERLSAAGVFGAEADRVMAFIADPYNHGIDRGLTHEDRLRNRNQSEEPF